MSKEEFSEESKTAISDDKKQDSSEDFESKKSVDEHIIKMLCPFWCAGAIIGTKGQGVKDLKEESCCDLKITQNFDNFPGTNERIVSLRGTIDRLKNIITIIQDKIRNDKPPADSAKPRNNDIRKGCLKLIVPYTAIGVIIGKEGQTTKELEEEHAVVLDVMKTVEAPYGLRENIVTIKGDADKSYECMSHILDMILGVKGQALMRWDVDYQRYANSFSSRRGKMRGGYRSAPPPPHPYSPQFDRRGRGLRGREDRDGWSDYGYDSWRRRDSYPSTGYMSRWSNDYDRGYEEYPPVRRGRGYYYR